LREEHGGLYVTEGSGRDGGVNRRALTAAAGLCVVIVAWALVNLFVEGMGFPVIDSEKVRGGEEAASALARLFGALVLGLFLHLVIKKRHQEVPARRQVPPYPVLSPAVITCRAAAIA